MLKNNKGGALALLLAGWLPAAGAVTFQVDTVVDEVDALLGDGQCATAGGLCTLRAAVQEANVLVGGDAVQLPAGLYVLSHGGAGEEVAAEGDLDIRDSLQLVGEGSGATVIDGNLSDRLFHVMAGGSLGLQGLTLQRGQVLGDGGAVLAEGALTLSDVVVWANTAADHGGGIFAAGTLALGQSVLEDNTAQQGGGLYVSATGSAVLEEGTLRANMADEGAGVYALGALSVQGSTLTANQADLQGGGAYLAAEGVFENSTLSANGALEGGAGVYVLGGVLSMHRTRLDTNRLSSNYGMGAGLYAGGQSQVTLSESELTGNGIDKPTLSGTSHGGGMYFGGITLSAENTTFSSNQADVGGGLEVGAGSAQLRYVTLAANSAPGGANLAQSGAGEVSLSATLLAEPAGGENCVGAVASLGYNLATDGSCALASSGDQPSVEAGLGLLEVDSGTHALVAGSAAIDSGPPEPCPLYDGAGWVRSDARCDVGAREAGAALAQGGTVRFELAGMEAGETAGSVSVSVIREGGNIPVSVDYETLGGSATSGVDYLPMQGELLWSADENGARAITLTIVDDSEYEPLESLQLLLTSAHGGAVIGTPSEHTLTVVDDDPEPVVEPPPVEEPLPVEEPPPVEEPCLPNHPQCLPPGIEEVPPGIEKKGGGALDPLWLFSVMLLWVMRRRRAV